MSHTVRSGRRRVLAPTRARSFSVLVDDEAEVERLAAERGDPWSAVVRDLVRGALRARAPLAAAVLLLREAAEETGRGELAQLAAELLRVYADLALGLPDADVRAPAEPGSAEWAAGEAADREGAPARAAAAERALCREFDLPEPAPGDLRALARVLSAARPE